jgi:hypothetical protein
MKIAVSSEADEINSMSEWPDGVARRNGPTEWPNGVTRAARDTRWESRVDGHPGGCPTKGGRVPVGGGSRGVVQRRVSGVARRGSI